MMVRASGHAAWKVAGLVDDSAGPKHMQAGRHMAAPNAGTDVVEGVLALIN